MTRPIVAALSAVALVVLALYAVFFAAFLPPTPYDSALTQAPVQFAERYLAWIVERNWAAVSAVTDPQVLNDEGWKGFAAIGDTVPKGTPTAIHVIGLNTTTSSGAERTGVTPEHVLPDKPFLADFVLRHDGTFIVEGVHVQLIAEPLEQHYAFRFLGQRPMNYVAFAGAVALIVFNAYALARCILMTGLRRNGSGSSSFSSASARSDTVGLTASGAMRSSASTSLRFAFRKRLSSHS
jgi:hypothetical protein